ncbi:hypothetical protein F0255_23380 [Vibrio coralliilyticus]|nr:hypothetical protein [Vibrio coralliilyticus]
MLPASAAVLPVVRAMYLTSALLVLAMLAHYFVANKYFVGDDFTSAHLKACLATLFVAAVILDVSAYMLNSAMASIVIDLVAIWGIQKNKSLFIKDKQNWIHASNAVLIIPIAQAIIS